MVLKGILEYLRNRIRDDRLYRPPPFQGWRGFIKRRINPPAPKIFPQNRIRIFGMGLIVNRYCNLSCHSCVVMGMNPPRDETTLEEIKAYLANMEGYDPDAVFRITGGEPTAMDHGKLENIAKLVRDSGYRVSLLTNGFKLVPPEWFDYIVLDKHGINDEDIEKWLVHLKSENYDKYEVRDAYWHTDIPYSMKDNISEGARCGAWMNSLTLWKDIVYPCCALMCVAWWNGDIDQKLASDLRYAGWEVYNPDLVDTIRNWRETLPGEAYRVCVTQCYRKASKTKWVKLI